MSSQAARPGLPTHICASGSLLSAVVGRVLSMLGVPPILSEDIEVLIRLRTDIAEYGVIIFKIVTVSSLCPIKELTKSTWRIQAML